MRASPSARRRRARRPWSPAAKQLGQAIQVENAAALKRDETKYKNTTDGSWLDEREDYFKALTESQYLRQRSRLIEILLLWWTDALRASKDLTRRELPSAASQTQRVAQKLSAHEILRRIRRVEEMRDHLGRNIQEALVIEVAFLSIFTF